MKILEMRPEVMTPVHRSGALAELVCSNSLGSLSPVHAGGILKDELRRAGSLIMEAAAAAKVPAGQALAVDRDIFSGYIEEALRRCGRVTVERREVKEIPRQELSVVATGPMTSPDLAASLQRLTGGDYLYFYDAVSPVVSVDSLDESKFFRASRYGKGEAEYLNCPMNREEYDAFLDALVAAEKVEDARGEMKFFESCLPVEEIGRRGRDTLRFGPMKPVGLEDPRTGELPYAVVQLRQENRDATMYNLVGFQTRLKWPEQRRVFSLIPALRQAEFFRLGVMHRNIFVNAPSVMEPTGRLRGRENVFLAGQLSGVEGYVESVASGFLCGLNAARALQGTSAVSFPPETAVGALMRYITSAPADNFQPMNINMGLFPPLEKKMKKKAERNEAIRERALQAWNVFAGQLQDPLILQQNKV